jgi:UDP-GlcNAc:undecaprenyl-phosphate GlcNAc-1-phosphate transferase
MEGWYPIIHLAAAILSISAFSLIKDRISVFLSNKNLVKTNYSGCRVITAGGLMLLFPCTAGLLPFLFVSFDYRHMLYMLCVFSLALAGFADDAAGDGASRGFAGHGRSVLEGRFTTGVLKAYTGVMLGLLSALVKKGGILEILINILVFALSVNFMNLLDLRPGRSIKVFSAAAVAVLLSSGTGSLWMVTPLASTLPAYIRGELREEYMLGDTGSNLIGGILGLLAVFSLGLTGKAVFFIFLAAVHAAAEFTSLSRLIDAVPILRLMDEAGRRKR